MEELVRKVELGNEILDTIIGVSIFRNNPEGKREILLVQHGGTGKWYFPGGKVRKGESMKTALKRELKEELGIDYNEKFSSFVVDSYEIKGKRLAIINVTASSPLLSEPHIQKSDAIKNFIWTTDPLNYDLTDQARELVEIKMNSTVEFPKRKKIKNPPNNL